MALQKQEVIQMITADYIKNRASELGIELDDMKAARLYAYYQAVEETNKQFNLTAITTPEEFAERHIMDSLVCAERPEVAGRVADVGTGAGFPGAVIGITKDVDLTLIEATQKKVDFAAMELSMLDRPCRKVHARAEDAARSELRESFDCVTSRGVASLPVLLEYCVPLVRVGGYFIAMKGTGAFEEERSASAEKILGVELQEVVHYVLKDDVRHDLIIYKKVAPTGEKYPRRGDRIRKSPL